MPGTGGDVRHDDEVDIGIFGKPSAIACNVARAGQGPGRDNDDRKWDHRPHDAAPAPTDSDLINSMLLDEWAAGRPRVFYQDREISGWRRPEPLSLQIHGDRYGD